MKRSTVRGTWKVFFSNKGTEARFFLLSDTQKSSVRSIIRCIRRVTKQESQTYRNFSLLELEMIALCLQLAEFWKLLVLLGWHDTKALFFLAQLHLTHLTLIPLHWQQREDAIIAINNNSSYINQSPMEVLISAKNEKKKDVLRSLRGKESFIHPSLHISWWHIRKGSWSVSEKDCWPFVYEMRDKVQQNYGMGGNSIVFWILKGLNFVP